MARTRNKPELTDAIEGRMARLEEALVALQNSVPAEDRIVERLSQRLSSRPAHPVPQENAIINAGKLFLPQMMPPMPTPPAGATPRPLWWPWELLQEFRYALRMFLDYRFQTAASTRYILVAIAVIYGCIWLFIAGSLMGGFLERFLLVGLTLVTYKVLGLEVSRYKHLLAVIAQHGENGQPVIRQEYPPR